MKEIESKEDLVLLHVTDYFPEDMIIKTPKDAKVMLDKEYEGHHYQVPRQRETVHFTINGEVENNTGGSWNSAKYIIVVPFTAIDNNNFVGGTSTDFYSKGSVQIPDGSYIICSKSEAQKYKGKIRDGIHVVEIDSENVKGHGNQLITELGYKVEQIGFWEWANSKDQKVVDSIIKKDFLPQAHFASKERRQESYMESLYSTAEIARIIKDNGLDIGGRENALFNKHQTDMGGYIVLTSDRKNMEMFNEVLKSVADIEIPPIVVDEIYSAKEGNITEEIKNRIGPDAYKEAYIAGKENFMSEYISDILVRHAILGEIELKRLKDNIDKSNGRDFEGLLRLYNSDLNKYTSSARRKEFFELEGIELSEKEIEILNNPKLKENNLLFEKFKNVPFDEIPDEYKSKINEIILKYNSKNSRRIDGFYISSDLMPNENGESSEYIKLINFNGSAETIEKLRGEMIRENGMETVLSMPLYLDGNTTLQEYVTKYESYLGNLETLLHGKQVESMSEEEISKRLSDTIKDYVLDNKDVIEIESHSTLDSAIEATKVSTRTDEIKSQSRMAQQMIKEQEEQSKGIKS